MFDIQLADFWNWFKKNSAHLHSEKYDTKLLNKLDETISSWGFGWEIGPGLTKANSLTISPNGTKDLLIQTSKIIEQAPLLDDWEFYSSKQSKDNWEYAKLDSIKIEATNWTYVLLKYPDNKIEILIKADNLKDLDKSTQELAVDLILTNLLGEKRKIEQLDFISIIDNHEYDNNVTQLKFLPAHLDKINGK